MSSYVMCFISLVISLCVNGASTADITNYAITETSHSSLWKQNRFHRVKFPNHNIPKAIPQPRLIVTEASGESTSTVSTKTQPALPFENSVLSNPITLHYPRPYLPTSRPIIKPRPEYSWKSPPIETRVQNTKIVATPAKNLRTPPFPKLRLPPRPVPKPKGTSAPISTFSTAQPSKIKAVMPPQSTQTIPKAVQPTYSSISRPFLRKPFKLNNSKKHTLASKSLSNNRFELQPKTETELEATSTPEPELISEAKPVSKPDPISLQSISEREPLPETEPIAEVESELESITEPELLPVLVPAIGPEIPEPEIVAEFVTAAVTEPELILEAEPSSEPKPIPDLATAPIIEPESLSTPEPPSGFVTVLLPEQESIQEPNKPQSQWIASLPTTTPLFTTSIGAVPTIVKPFPVNTLPLPSGPLSPAEPTVLENSDLMANECKSGNGYFAVANECDMYIECKNNVATEYLCPDGLHFKPNARWTDYPCAYSSEVKCKNGSKEQPPHPTAECPRQYGFYSLNDEDCSRYIRCREGFATVMTCPNGLVFNVEKHTCDWPENVPSCNSNIFQGFICPTPAMDQDSHPSDFIFNYRYGKSCKQYVACQRGFPRLLSCDTGLSFDEASRLCVNSDLVQNC